MFLKNKCIANGYKLFSLMLTLILFLPGLLLLINHYTFRLPYYIPLLIGFLPFFNIGVLIIFNLTDKGFGDTISSIKYYNFCPLVFYYDPIPYKYRFKDSSEVKNILKPGDVILQRHDNYLHSLVLGQTSYFTHAGIFYGDYNDKPDYVIHAEGSTGVDFKPLDEFIRCDDIAIVRFDTSKINTTDCDFPDTNYFIPKKAKDKGATYYEIQLTGFKNTASLTEIESGSAYGCENKIPKKVEDLIMEEANSVNDKLKPVAKKQSVFLESLLTDPKINIPVVNSFKPVILEIAAAYKGTEYDYGFNFTNMARLSCIEFVWVCYKALFPLHRIDREKVSYFGFVNTYVIVPDMFLRSKLFTLQFNSISDDTIKALTLYEKIRKKRKNFWLFYLKIIGWQSLLLILAYLIFMQF